MKDLTGQKFGRLTALEPTNKRCNRSVVWLCQCECGNMALIVAANLVRGDTKSCGCLQKERTRNIHIKHGMYKTLAYNSWTNMLQRCYNPKCRDYKSYMNRGIKVCDRWRHSFENFYADMGKRPKGKTLDRWPNNDGNYEPSNCRWATPKEQANNTRKQRWFLAYGPNGEVIAAKSQSKFAKRHSLSSTTISGCLHNRQKSIRGWRFKFIEDSPAEIPL